MVNKLADQSAKERGNFSLDDESGVSVLYYGEKKITALTPCEICPDLNPAMFISFA